MTLEKGQVFSIRLDKGFGFIQFIETDDLGIEYVRILDSIRTTEKITQSEVNLTQRWCCGFLVKTAYKKNLIEFIGKFELPPKYKVEYITRAPHNVKGEHLGWHIINRVTLERKLIPKLKRKHFNLSPHGIFNDTLIKERLLNNWELSKWGK